MNVSPRRPNLTQQQKEYAFEARERGESYATIAAHLGSSVGSIAWQCLAAGADPPNAKPIDPTIRTPLVVTRNGKPVRRFTPEDDAKLKAMDAEGKTHTQMGRALGRRANSIKGRLMTLARHEERALAHNGANHEQA